MSGYTGSTTFCVWHVTPIFICEYSGTFRSPELVIVSDPEGVVGGGRCYFSEAGVRFKPNCTLEEPCPEWTSKVGISKRSPIAHNSSWDGHRCHLAHDVSVKPECRVCNLRTQNAPKMKILDSAMRTDALLETLFAMGYSTWSHLLREYTVSPRVQKRQNRKIWSQKESKLTQIFKNETKMPKIPPVNTEFEDILLIATAATWP
jgi:hypothetical protein